MKRWGLAGLTVLFLAVLAFGLWWIASPPLADGDRLGFALQVAFYGLLSGGVAYWLGKWTGRGAEREAARARGDRDPHSRESALDRRAAAVSCADILGDSTSREPRAWE